jgi:hypothetical protein
MSADIELFVSHIYSNQVDTGKVSIITKDCYLRGFSCTKTEVYEYVDDGNDLLECVVHNTADKVSLKKIHNAIVNKWQKDPVESGWSLSVEE